jgi:hypothetical protein
MAEKLVFSEASVVITSQRITIDGEDYVVNQIESSRVEATIEINPIRDLLLKLAIVTSIVAGFGGGIATGSFVLAGLLIVGGMVVAIVLFNPVDRMYHLRIGLTSGERDAFTTRDLAYAASVNKAIHEALASRGGDAARH